MKKLRDINTDPRSNIDMGMNFQFDMDEGIGMGFGDRDNRKADIKQGKSPRPIVTWKNRRRMAWIALITMIVFISILVFDGVSVERIEVLEPIINTFLYVLGGVIVAYMGFTSLPFFGMGGKR